MDGHNYDSLYDIFLQVIRQHYQLTYRLLDEIGLYPGQPPMLFALNTRDGQSQKDLANKLGVKPATITVMLKRMEKSGLVKRYQDIDDQRISRVYITDRGREICKELKRVKENIETECFKNFTVEEQILFRRLLMQMGKDVSKIYDNYPEI